MTVLQTMRLTLRPCCPSDRADFMSLERDPEVMRFLNGGHAVDHEQIDPNATFLMPRGTEPHVLDGASHRQRRVRRVVLFVAREQDGGRTRLSPAPDGVGSGFASEGASALVDWGFRSGGYDKVVATTMAVNHASRRVMEKIGLTYARTVFVDRPDPIPGNEHGDVWYELARTDWNRLRDP